VTAADRAVRCWRRSKEVAGAEFLEGVDHRRG
jgi:hypothetical protein